MENFIHPLEYQSEIGIFMKSSTRLICSIFIKFSWNHRILTTEKSSSSPVKTAVYISREFPENALLENEHSSTKNVSDKTEEESSNSPSETPGESKDGSEKDSSNKTSSSLSDCDSSSLRDEAASTNKDAAPS